MRKITDLDRSKIEEQKKAVRAGYDMDIIPSDLATYGSEGHKDSCGTGGQSSLDLNLIETQRQTAHQPFFLLEVQPGQLTVILLSNRAFLKDVVAKLTGIVRCVQHQNVPFDLSGTVPA